MRKLCFVLAVLALVLGSNFVAVRAEVEPLAITVTLDKETVAVGETVTATWAVTGGEAPYSDEMFTEWTVKSAGSNLFERATVTTKSENEFTSSFVPTVGESVYLRVQMQDNGGRYVYENSSTIPVTGGAVFEPLDVTISLNKETVAVGESVTATWAVTGGEAPYSDKMFTEWTVKSAGSNLFQRATVTTKSENEFMSSFVPTVGESVYLRVQMQDNGGRYIYENSSAIPIYFSYTESISTTPSVFTIHAFETQKMEILHAPSNVSDKRITWSSSDNSIATVDETGLVTGVKAGEATITATTLDGSNLTAQATVQVLPPILVDSIQLSGDQELNVGGTVKLTTSILPENAGDKTLTWSTSNASVATVADGLVTATGYGSATITATAAGGASASCVVTVDPAVEQLRAVAYGLGVTTTSSGRYITFSGGAQYGTAPYNATYRLLSNNSELTSKSMITNGIEELSYSIGSSIVNATFTVTVDVTDANGHMSSARTSAQIYINGWNMSFTELEETPILVKLTGISMETAPPALVPGGQYSMPVTFIPENATEKSLIWFSSDETIVSVDQGGKIIAVAPGTATITATAQDGSGVSGSAEITVNKMKYNMSGVAWDYTGAFTHDGTEKTVALTGLPAGLTPSYTGNTATEAGIYSASVTFTYDTVNYEAPAMPDLTWAIEPAAVSSLPGDATSDGTIDILDLVSIIDWIVSNTSPASLTNADATGEGDIDILDLVWIIDKIVGG
jgi:uncharacterized protein YjdB